ncbi:Putative protein RSN1 [Fusarium oxysporum f. sp. cubense race 1]|uniref:Uncharacterized protein n=1 Tax=Fusarium oxysporum f. sp. cubense (strain race 1) TaxID=1229664 RepID=N4TKT3_FUSC1|nr:Putative protein RSN1 [Fusarium oxysporum f. sp. cubense race 1]
MSSTNSDASGSATDSATGTAASVTSSIVSSLLSSAISASETLSASETASDEPTKTSSGGILGTTPETTSAADTDRGIGIVTFLTALVVAVIIFTVQLVAFLLLRNKLARIFKPKTYLVPERERTESPPRSVASMLKTLWHYDDREVINKCGLDAYFFLRYLKTLLIIFLPICCIVMPILIPINFVGGIGQKVNVNETERREAGNKPTGLDTLAFGNVSPKNTSRYAAHLLMGILVIIWVCWVFFIELKVYIKVRQDYLTSAEHRLRASATTVLVNSIPAKWLSEDALRGLFDVFPGGIRNIWINRDLSPLLDKVKERNEIHAQLESAETDLIKAAKKAQLKQAKAAEKKERKEKKLKALSKQERAERQAEKYLKKKDRPTHRLPLFGQSWLFGVPFVTKKVDTIYWCREQLARLNLEIDEDAHMACQSVIHHLPKHMTPRMNEIAPRDVIWDNMAFSWWQEWLRSGIVFVAIVTMVFLWAIPVAWTAALSQLDNLIRNNKWLHFLKDNEALHNAAKAIAGVLPAVLLGLLLFLVPIILGFFADFKGAKTGSQKAEFVQRYYFVFLFIQVFLIVSIASFFAASIDAIVENVKQLQTVGSVLDLLANNLPTAANYFFSYMILQAMSTSSATLLQLGALLMWYVIAKMLDSTARNKWSRNTRLNQVNWGRFFPIYTNFACIGLIYCVIAPLISIFAIITFALLWMAQRYAMLYVTRFEHDTGGVLYPRAINQTFTGIYFMELCMAGLFFITEDENGKNTCTTHGIIMIVVLILTVLYQVLLNYSFGPLFRYLPITFEDEAVLRDQAFQRAQDQRLGLLDDDELQEETEETNEYEKSRGSENGNSIEMRRFGSVRRPMNKVGTWAKGGGQQLRKFAAVNKAKDKNKRASQYRKEHRQKDIEAQRAIGEALFGGIHDEIEDLTPDERDALVRHAFQHEALRARRPTVWIPRDDLGISDDEIRRTQAYSEHIWISNEGTALDSKVRVVYGRAPPDFSEVDLINL